MSPAVESAYGFLEQHLPRALKQSADAGKPVTCCEGCSACCSEPAYATRDEIEAMLETLTDEQRAEVAVATQTWLFRVQNNPIIRALFREDPLPDAVLYRHLRLPCPFLKNHRCIAYERRPVTCRLFMVSGPRAACEDLSRRGKQEFVLTPDLQTVAIGVLTIGLDNYHYDHIGVILAEILLGIKMESAARLAPSPWETEKMRRGAEHLLANLGLQVIPTYEATT